MTYVDFMIDLNTNYHDFWNIGLKKKANSSLKKKLQEFNKKINEEARFSILYEFCEHYCDCSNTMNPKYTDRRLPYELMRIILEYLNRFSDSMPQVKWLYVFTGDATFLDKAFDHKACDQEVVEYKFERYIDTLDWGAHHASEGIMIISDDLAQETINNCLLMIQKFQIPINFKN